MGIKRDGNRTGNETEMGMGKGMKREWEWKWLHGNRRE